MPRIRCRYADCIFLEGGYCSAAAVEIDPDAACATYLPLDGASLNDWDDDESLEDWETETLEEDDDELWLDEVL